MNSRLALFRRRAVGALASVLVTVTLAGQTPAPGGPAENETAATRSPEDPQLVWTPNHVVLVSKEVAPAVFAVFPDDAAAKNAAGVPVATSGGFVIGDNGVLVIESMLNRRLAEQMLALIRAQTAKPILYLVNTSYHGDHSYGNQFFPAGVQIVQHVATQAYIQTHFAADVAFMMQYFGRNSGMDELRPQRAQILLQDGARVQFELGNKSVQVLHLGFAQTDGDLFVWLPAEKVIFTGNPIISDGPSLPWLLDGKMDASLTTMRKLLALLPRDAVVVPGHGRPTGIAAIEYPIGYLEELKRQVSAAIADGLTEAETVQRLAVSMTRYAGYKIFPWVHSQINVPKTYQELKKGT
ncbi:MBL fold metallo-hydrolase [Opitutaceae bacterium EW11]|nr:MBL fold metallo-hydrolase [Opitutaceae bacterium EW11]